MPSDNSMQTEVTEQLCQCPRNTEGSNTSFVAAIVISATSVLVISTLLLVIFLLVLKINRSVNAIILLFK